MQLVVLFDVYHFSKTFQILSNLSKKMQLFHCSLKLRKLIPNLPLQMLTLAQPLRPPLHRYRRLSSFIGQPPAISVIEEKGEGFENGKTDHWLIVA
jgi:hypothetical protein